MTIFEEIEQLEQEATVFGLEWETKDQIKIKGVRLEWFALDLLRSLYQSSPIPLNSLPLNNQ